MDNLLYIYLKVNYQDVYMLVLYNACKKKVTNEWEWRYKAMVKANKIKQKG